MEIALRRTYDATPEPQLVVAVGDCGCTGGIFGESYASARPRRQRDSGRRRDARLSADAHALLQGILAAITQAAPAPRSA